MIDIFAGDTLSMVLLALSCFSLVLSLSFYLKLLVLRKLSTNLYVSVFDKTFSVLDPSSELRGASKSIFLALLLPILGYVLGGYLFLQILGMGLATHLIVVFLFFILTMIYDAFEVYTVANLFIEAIEKRTNLGVGDLNALHLINRVMPRLSGYYFFLATVFFALATNLPYFDSIAQLILALASVGAESASYIGALALFITAFLYASFVTIASVAGRRLKYVVFGFSPSVRLTSLEQQLERTRTMVVGQRGYPVNHLTLPAYAAPI